MTKSEVLAYWGNNHAEVARALDMSQPSVYLWKDPIPPLRQLQIERVTNGALRAGPECDQYRVPSAV